MWFSYAPIGSHTTNNQLSTVKSLAVPANANGMLVQAITQNVRISFSGNATATSGFQIKAGDPAVMLPVSPGASISVIEETGTAVLQIQFVRVHEQGS